MKAKPFTAIIASMVLISSCKKDHDQPETTPSDGQVTATVEGKSFKPVSIAAVANTNDSTFLITAKDKDDNSVMITGPTKTGTFTNSNDNVTSGSYINSSGAVWMSSFEGTMTLAITKFDKTAKKISGTFSFTAGAVGTSDATGTKTVTNGSFSDVSVIL